MFIYKATKAQFLSDVENGCFIDKLSKLYEEKIGDLEEKEVQSWKNSDAVFMYQVLADSRIPNDLGVAVEYRAPGCSGRIDMVLSGKGKDSQRKILFIELKQWTGLHISAERDAYILNGDDESNLREHPSKQVYQYKEWVRMSTPEADRKFVLGGCVYLHNYMPGEKDELKAEEFQDYYKQCPMYYKDDKDTFIRLLVNAFAMGDEGEGIEYVEEHCIGSSIEMKEWLNDIVNGCDDNKLSPEQQNILDKISEIVDKNINTNQKYTIVVQGNPGTGKSVIAIKALFENYRKTNVNGRCLYLSKNAAPRDVFLSGFYRTKHYDFLKNIMNDSGFFAREATVKSFLTVVDETQRVGAFTKGKDKNGKKINYSDENQIDNVIEHANVSVFFIDERQVVSLADAGTIEQIRASAIKYNAQLIELPRLTAQFRCNGSSEYVDWVDNTLGISDKKIMEKSDYDIEVIRDFSAFMKEMQDKNTNNNARIVAGYCWPWISRDDVSETMTDFPIAGMNLRWNNYTWLGGKKRVWATERQAFKQIGCIHTCQGLEFDYIGVIIGDDLRYENGRVITDYRERAEDDFTCNAEARRDFLKANSDNQELLENYLDKIIKNTYRILLTRGMKGCRVYCTNSDLATHLERQIKLLKGLEEE